MILLLVNVQPSISLLKETSGTFQIKRIFSSETLSFWHFFAICSKTSNWPSILFDGSHTILILKGEGGWSPVFIWFLFCLPKYRPNWKMKVHMKRVAFLLISYHIISDFFSNKFCEKCVALSYIQESGFNTWIWLIRQRIFLAKKILPQLFLIF